MRLFGEQVMYVKGATLIRINPASPKFPATVRRSTCLAVRARRWQHSRPSLGRGGRPPTS